MTPASGRNTADAITLHKDFAEETGVGKRIVASTSTCCLDYYEHSHDIRMIRIKLEINGKLYADGTEMPADKFYKMLEDDPTLIPKTSQVPIGELLEFFEGLYAEGYDEVFVTTISAKLSGSYNGIVAAAGMLADKMKIETYDTKTVCFNEGMFALRASEMIEAGASFDEVRAALDHMAENNMIMFAVEHLDFLIKNGRLSNAAGFGANLLQIKPLLEVQSDGEIRSIKNIRKITRALDEVAQRAKEYTAGHKDYFIYYVATTTERLEYLKEATKLALGENDFPFMPCTPIVGCHVGNGAIGIGIFLND